jgi:hypothetical protein
MGQTNLDKSIRTKTLKYNENLLRTIWRWAERGLFYFVGAAFIFFPSKNIWEGLTADHLPITQIIFAFLVITTGVWLIYSLVYLDKLSLIKGADKELNRKKMYELLTDMFVDTKFFFVDDQLFGIRPLTMKKPGREITVIFNDSDILINITHKIRFGDLDSPFHVLTNQMDIKGIEKNFLSSKNDR